MRKKIKENVYNVIATSGIWFLQKFFPDYFATEPLRPTDRFVEYPFVLKNLPFRGSKVLDVGCSGSMFPLLLNSLCYETYGLDIRKYYPQCKFFFKEGNICIAPFKNETFDAVTAISSIEHIGIKGCYGQSEDLDSDMTAIKEIHRILKPFGLLLMTVPFAEKAKVELNHKIYDMKKLEVLLSQFSYDIKIEQSPEADYKLALIRAIK